MRVCCFLPWLVFLSSLNLVLLLQLLQFEVGGDLRGCGDGWVVYTYMVCSLSTFALSVVVEWGITLVSTRGESPPPPPSQRNMYSMWTGWTPSLQERKGVSILPPTLPPLAWSYNMLERALVRIEKTLV